MPAAAKDGHFLESGSGPTAYLNTFIKKVKPQDFTKTVSQSQAIIDQPIDDQAINQLIAQNPDMNAGTFYNLLKSKGAKIIGITQTQADSMGAGNAIALTRAGVKKESTKPKSKNVRLLEKSNAIVPDVKGTPANEAVGFTKFKVILIEEGLGNFGSCHFYTREALESGVALFEGIKLYADHPDAIEEQVQPERTVEDIAGYYSDLAVEDGPSGQAQLTAIANVMGSLSKAWVRELMTTAVEYAERYPDKDFVGLSINAGGDAIPTQISDLLQQPLSQDILPKLQEALAQGITEVNLVTQFTEAVSCDLVTEAGAKGKIMQMLESKGVTMPTKKTKENAVDPKAKKTPVDPAADDPTTASAEASGGVGGKPVPPPPKSADDANDGADDSGDGAAGHDDQAQDVQLIKSMIKKYLGADDASDEECGAVKQAYEAHKEMGETEEKAQEKACEALKLAKHMASKEHKENEQKEAKIATEKAAKEAAEKESDHKEANIRLRIENAQLKETVARGAVATEVDKVVAAKKLTGEIEKSFRESTASAKSIKDVQSIVKIFESVLKTAPQAAPQDEWSFAMIEKQTVTKSSSASKIDFSNISTEI